MKISDGDRGKHAVVGRVQLEAAGFPAVASRLHAGSSRSTADPALTAPSTRGGARREGPDEEVAGAVVAHRQSAGRHVERSLPYLVPVGELEDGPRAGELGVVLRVSSSLALVPSPSF